MFMRSRTGVGKGTVVIVIIVAIVVAAVGYWAYTLQSTPQLQVSRVSLDPHSISLNSNATLTFTVKNNDPAESQDVTTKFNVTSVVFYLSGISLNYGNDGLQYWTTTLQSSQESTFVFKVTGVLTGGAQSSTYSIRLDFYDENATRFTSETQSLTVTSG